MYLVYVDESGDPGRVRSPSPSFTLAMLLLEDRHWLDTLDRIVAYRRFLKSQFNLKMHDEVKAHYLNRKSGPFVNLDLSDDARRRIYRGLLRLIVKLGTIRVFAVVINKAKIEKQTIDVRDCAWQYAIQRLERFGRANSQNLHVLPDEGHGQFIKDKIRTMRRFSHVRSAYGGPTLPRNATNIIEDPSDRQSHESYFIQLADLCAYAAYRTIYPVAEFDGAMWNELGDARVAEVNSIRGGPAGIVSWP